MKKVKNDNSAYKSSYEKKHLLLTNINIYKTNIAWYNLYKHPCFHRLVYFNDNYKRR